MLYGILQGVLLVLNLFSAVIWGASDNGTMFNFASQMICSAIIGIFYFLIYKTERRASNRYYLSTLSIWGILAISTPFILFATRLVLALSKSELVTDNLVFLTDYENLINIVLVCIAIITVGYIVNKRGLVGLAILILFCFITIKVLPTVNIYIKLNLDNQLQISISSIFYCVVNIFGYIGLGLILLRQEKKSANI